MKMHMHMCTYICTYACILHAYFTKCNCMHSSIALISFTEANTIIFTNKYIFNSMRACEYVSVCVRGCVCVCVCVLVCACVCVLVYVCVYVCV